MIIFIIASMIYVTSLAVVDALVNRLIFRENHKFSYFSPEKEKIYKMKEWQWYCFLFLIVLPIVIPVTLSYLIGGPQYILIYVLVFVLIDWDIIFGKVVFDKWFGDLPSICLPFVGWIHFKIVPTIIIRLVLAILILLILF